MQKRSCFLVFATQCWWHLGHNQQQRPTVHSVGVSRGRVRGCGCCRYWHVTGDRWHMTPDMWHLTTDTLHLKLDTWHLTPDTWNLTTDCFLTFCTVATLRTCWEIQCLWYVFSLNRPHWDDSVIELLSPSSVCLRHWVPGQQRRSLVSKSVAHCFWGLSLALMSHDQFQASH